MNRYRVRLVAEVEVDANSEREAFDEAVEYVADGDVAFSRHDAEITQIEVDEFDRPWNIEDDYIEPTTDSDIWG
jgi:hypothetical protein